MVEGSSAAVLVDVVLEGLLAPFAPVAGVLEGQSLLGREHAGFHHSKTIFFFEETSFFATFFFIKSFLLFFFL